MGRKKLIYLGLLVSAGGAFIVDRLFLGEPETAAAAPSRPVKTTRKPAPRKRPPKEKPPPAADPSLTWLNQLGEQQGQRDVFVPSVDMLKYYKALRDPADEEEKEGGPDATSPEAFEREHELQATCVSPDALMAVIDGKVRRLGEKIDGYRLTKIEAYRAEFRRGRDRVSLIIPVPAVPE